MLQAFLSLQPLRVDTHSNVEIQPRGITIQTRRQQQLLNGGTPGNPQHGPLIYISDEVALGPSFLPFEGYPGADYIDRAMKSLPHDSRSKVSRLPKEDTEENMLLLFLESLELPDWNLKKELWLFKRGITNLGLTDIEGEDVAARAVRLSQFERTNLDSVKLLRALIAVAGVECDGETARRFAFMRKQTLSSKFTSQYFLSERPHLREEQICGIPSILIFDLTNIPLSQRVSLPSSG